MGGAPPAAVFLHEERVKVSHGRRIGIDHCVRDGDRHLPYDIATP